MIQDDTTLLSCKWRTYRRW